MCGLRRTTIILTLISIIITGIIFSQEVKFKGNETLETLPKREVKEKSWKVNMQYANDDVTLRAGSSFYPDEDPLSVTVRAGSSVSFLCDPITITRGENYNTEAVREQFGKSLYICKGSCWWSQVVAYYGPEATGTDPRFEIKIVELQHKPVWGGNRCVYCDETRVIPEHLIPSTMGTTYTKSYAWIMNVTIKEVTLQDEGLYYCAWALVGTDGYQEVRIKVKPPEKHEAQGEVKEIIKELRASAVHSCSDERGEASQDIDFFMGSNLNQETKEIRIAKAKCGGNYACALALLQRRVVADEV
ncbi:MAG: hypothetical protein ACRC7H_02830, partial [Plesiomonas shigelloides]